MATNKAQISEPNANVVQVFKIDEKEIEAHYRSRKQQVTGLIKQKSIKDKLQDIIDDRGSDLSDNEDYM